MTAHYHQIALDFVHPGDARKKSPTLKSQLLEEPQARVIVAENAAHQSVDLQGGSLRDGPFKQSSSHS